MENDLTRLIASCMGPFGLRKFLQVSWYGSLKDTCWIQVEVLETRSYTASFSLQIERQIIVLYKHLSLAIVLQVERNA